MVAMGELDGHVDGRVMYHLHVTNVHLQEAPPLLPVDGRVDGHVDGTS